MARNFIGGNALRLPPIAHKAAGVISGIGIDYPGAPRAADVPLKDSGRLYEALRDGKFVLLTPDPSVVPPEHVVVASPADTTVPWTLVRPDAHVAWRGGRDGVAAALRQVA
jgi:hypothetical protein